MKITFNLECLLWPKCQVIIFILYLLFNVPVSPSYEITTKFRKKTPFHHKDSWVVHVLQTQWTCKKERVLVILSLFNILSWFLFAFLLYIADLNLITKNSEYLDVCFYITLLKSVTINDMEGKKKTIVLKKIVKYKY